MLYRLLIFAVMMTGAATPQDFDARMQDLSRKHGPGTDEELKQRLWEMGSRDQSSRQYDMARLSASQQRMINDQMLRSDRQLSAELKEIVAEKGWPTIKLVGLQASNDAARILSHSPDLEFQRSLAEKLEKLVADGEIVGSNIAPVIDKVLVADGKPQRYGTQYLVSDGKATIQPIEDPDHLEQRRAQFMLPTMAQFKRMLSAFHDLRVE